MKGYGVNFPLERRRLSEQRAWIQGLEALGYESLWSSEARQYDGLTPLALASEWAPGMRLGCAVLPAQTRGPALLAMSAATLAQLAPGRVAIGIGSSSQADRRVVELHPLREALRVRARPGALPARGARRGQGRPRVRELRGARVPARGGARDAPPHPDRRAALEECRKRVRAFLEGGVDTVILQFMEVDPFEAVRALAPD